MKDLEQAVRPVILQPGRSLLELARSFTPPDASQQQADQLAAALGLEPGVRFDFIVGRDLFTRVPAALQTALARLLLSLAAEDGALSIAQVIPGRGQRLSTLVSGDDPALARKLEAAEERAYSDPSNVLVSWREDGLAAALREAGGRDVRVETERSLDTRRITEREMAAWLAPSSAYGRALSGGLETAELSRVHEMFRSQIVGREVPWASVVAFLVARR